MLQKPFLASISVLILAGLLGQVRQLLLADQRGGVPSSLLSNWFRAEVGVLTS